VLVNADNKEGGGLADALAASVLKICEEILEVGDISLEDNFFFLGGDSLNAFALLSRLEEEYGVVLEEGVLYEVVDLNGVVELVRSRLGMDGVDRAGYRMSPMRGPTRTDGSPSILL